MPIPFEVALSQSEPFVTAMQDDAFANRFCAILRLNGCVCSLDANEHWVGSYDEIASLIVRLRGRGEDYVAYLYSGEADDPFEDEKVVLAALEALGWRVADNDEMLGWPDCYGLFKREYLRSRGLA